VQKYNGLFSSEVAHIQVVVKKHLGIIEFSTGKKRGSNRGQPLFFPLKVR